MTTPGKQSPFLDILSADVNKRAGSILSDNAAAFDFILWHVWVPLHAGEDAWQLAQHSEVPLPTGFSSIITHLFR